MARRSKKSAPPVDAIANADALDGKTVVDGALIFAAALVLSLVISWAPLNAAMRGEADPLGVGIRYLVGFTVSWIGLLGFGNLLAHYTTLSAANDPEPDEASLGSAHGDHPLRRTDDPNLIPRLGDPIDNGTNGGISFGDQPQSVAPTGLPDE